jgi:O-antigen/teichoic acid export membrane protein
MKSLADLQQNRLLRLLTSTVFNQALLSGTNFLVGFLLIRYTADQAYGHYLLVFSAIMLMTSLQGGWVGPLYILAPKQTEAVKAEMVGAIYHSLNRFWPKLMLGMVLVWCAFELTTFVLHHSNGMAWVWLIAIAAGGTALRRDYLRTALLIHTRPQVMLLQDVFYAAVLLASALIAVAVPEHAAVIVVAGLAAAAFVSNWGTHRSLSQDPGLPEGHAAPIWQQLRNDGGWAVIGVVVFWSFSQGYNYLIAAQLSVAAVASVGATRLLLMPVNLLTNGVKNQLVPLSAAWFHEHGGRFLMNRTQLIILVLLALSGAYALVLWFLQDWIMGTLLKKNFPHQHLLIGLWIAIFLIGMVRDMYQNVLLVLRQFRLLAVLAAISAVVSLSAIAAALWQHQGVLGVLYGLLLGEILYLLGVVVMAYRHAFAAPVKHERPALKPELKA